MTDFVADLLLTDALVVHETGTVPGAIAIADGRIAAVGEARAMPPARETIALGHRHVLPGVIDPHVHFRDPGLTHKEDWQTGSAAAAIGGVTTVFEMPNTVPPTDTPEHFALKHAAAAAKSTVDFGLYGLFAEHNLDQLPALAEAGAIGFKLFLGETTGGLPPPCDGAVLEGFEILAGLGLRCAVHAENTSILAWRGARIRATGRTDPLAHLAMRTDVVAVEALNRVCTIADWTGARVHIVHESTAKSLPFIRFWKERGVDLTVETLPQYLTLDAEMMLRPGGGVLRMNPPIREKAQQEPLWQAVVDGTIDMIATDHAPHTAEEKRGDAIWDIACGFPGVETSLPLMLTAVEAGRFPIERLATLMSGAPARAFGLYGRKGVIRPGADADLVVIDRDRRATLSADALHSRSKVSVFEGMAVSGLPAMTFVRGRLVAKDGRIVGEPGWGRLVRPAMDAPAPCNRNTTMNAVLQPGQRPWG